jgi:lactoylglutathione lyase
VILNHVNLTVPDVVETAAFLETYFDLRTPEGADPKATFAVLFDDRGLVLTLMRGKRGTEIAYPATFHIGFMQETEERVNEIHRRLVEDGYQCPPPERSHAWTFYVRAPGGFDIEVASP